MRQPHEYPRRILLCVTGMSPQVVTESIYALAVNTSPAFVPTEVHLVSTTDGVERAELMLLSPSKGFLRSLISEYELPPIALGGEQMHVIRDVSGKPLADIRTPEENAAAADTITALMAELTADEDAALHVSIAGGRKTMGYYLGYALSLFGRDQDRLSHVLVQPEFENLTDFYYPARQQRTLINREQRPVDAAKARVELAEIPFVRLRNDLPKSHLRQLRFSDAVVAASRSREPAKLRINYAEQKVYCNAQTVELSPQSFVFYSWLAERCWGEIDDGGLVSVAEYMDPHSTLRKGLVEIGDRLFPNEMGPGFEQWKLWDSSDFGQSSRNWIHQRCNDVKQRLIDALGLNGARPFLIQSVRLKGRNVGYRIGLEAEQIELNQQSG